ncbi:MAG: TraB/GumN family protein [Candidatus Fibromonas sp.]|jgi:pheromone shutdown-related protein TraB|nr:TraB/GumN family protein [Candidatus Fibromonas sp.]
MTASNDIIRINISPEREIILLGTAHISQESVDLVRSAIAAEKPDSVCVELDENRLKALEDSDRWKNLDVKSVLKKRQMPSLILNLLLASYQKRMGESTGVKPGSELKAAVEETRACNANLILADRDVKITLNRSWASTPFFRKFKLLAALLGSIFETEKISEEELGKMREQDTLSVMMDDFGKAFPEIKQILISERDQFLAGRILKAEGKKVLAVVGAGHLQGIKGIIESKQEIPAEEDLCKIPPPSHLGTIIGWGIPSAIILSLVYIGIKLGPSDFANNALFWALATGLPAAFGATCALAHPLAILTALFLAPITTLHPLIGVGMFTAFVQAYFCPPRVYEIETAADDIWKPSRWWKNRFTRVFLAFILPGLPTTIGSLIGLGKIAKTISGE